MEETEAQPSPPLVVLAVVFEGGLAVLAAVIGWAIGYLPWRDVRLDPAAAGIGALAALPPLVVMVAMVRWPIGPLRSTAEVVHRHLTPLFRGCSLWDLATISLLAGFGEELLFRGLVQGAVSLHWGAAAGIVAASLLFGLAHSITLLYVLMAGLIGAYLSALWLWTDNLLAPITAHAVYDFLALWYLTARGGEEEPDAPADETDGE